MRGEEVVAGGIVIPERSVAPVIGRNMDAENHQRPDDGGGQRQRLEVSSERGGGPPGEPGEPEHDRAAARPDDRAVRGNSWKRGTPSPSSTFGTRRTFHWTRSPA